MRKVRIFSVGKNKEKWLEEAIQEYVKRLTGVVSFEFLWAKDDQQLIEWTQKEPVVICLDPAGKLLTSEQFSSFVQQQWEKGGAKIALVIGGAEGLPPLLKNSPLLISLSPLTFTHQLTRLILVEQIYRALEIQRGSSYHK